MKVTFRLTDDLLGEIDRVAAANGQSRSAWINLALMRAVMMPSNDELPRQGRDGTGHPDDQVRVTVRLDRTEIEAIQTVGKAAGLNRNEWIKRTIRWQLWDKAAALRLVPANTAELGKIRKLVMAISKNINQAVTAMHAANRRESSPDVARIAASFPEIVGDLRGLLSSFQDRLDDSIGGEVAYWVGSYSGSRA